MGHNLIQCLFIIMGWRTDDLWFFFMCVSKKIISEMCKSQIKEGVHPELNLKHIMFVC